MKAHFREAERAKFAAISATPAVQCVAPYATFPAHGAARRCAIAATAVVMIASMTLAGCTDRISVTAEQSARTRLGGICANANSAQATLASDVPNASQEPHRHRIVILAGKLHLLSEKAEAAIVSSQGSPLAENGRAIKGRLWQFEAALRAYLKAVPVHGSTSSRAADAAFAAILRTRDALTSECAQLTRLT